MWLLIPNPPTHIPDLSRWICDDEKKHIAHEPILWIWIGREYLTPSVPYFYTICTACYLKRLNQGDLSCLPSPTSTT